MKKKTKSAINLARFTVTLCFILSLIASSTTVFAEAVDNDTEPLTGAGLGAFSGYSVSEDDVLYIAQTIYGEAGSDYISTAEKAMVAWTILNRLDDGWAGSVLGVVSSPGQFYGWLSGSNPPESLMAIARDVLQRHAAEQDGKANVGRVLPKGYYYFYGDGAHNYFYSSGSGKYDFSAEGYPSPY